MLTLPPTPTERLAEAVDGAAWVRYDKRHKLVFIGKDAPYRWSVHTWDIPTGQPYDAPWPLDDEQVRLLGLDAAFTAAVAERVNRGY